jgi:hypothetical protein
MVLFEFGFFRFYGRKFIGCIGIEKVVKVAEFHGGFMPENKRLDLEAYKRIIARKKYSFYFR